MKKPTKTFLLETFVLIAILLLQISGLFRGLNELVNSTLPLLDGRFMELLTSLGGDAFLVPFMALVVLLDLRKGGLSKKTLAFIISAFVGLAIVGFLKVALSSPRPRPLPGANVLSAGAFPSGHTFRASIIASYVSDRWKKLAPLAWAYAVGIALTRLFLHYHWLSDVLFSLVLAPWLYTLVKSVLGADE